MKQFAPQFVGSCYCEAEGPAPLDVEGEARGTLFVGLGLLRR